MSSLTLALTGQQTRRDSSQSVKQACGSLVKFHFCSRALADLLHSYTACVLATDVSQHQREPVLKLIASKFSRLLWKKRSSGPVARQAGRLYSQMVSALDSELRGPSLRLGQVNVLCSWAKHFTLTVPFSTLDYK